MHSALQIILQLSKELSELKTGCKPMSNSLQGAIGHIDELESVDSLVDLLNFIKDENMQTGLLL